MARAYLYIVLFCSLWMLASCKKSTSSIAAATATATFSLTPLEQQKAAADNAFTFTLFKTVAAGNTANVNLLLSPLSVSMAMGMTNNGSNGQTLADINSTMDFTGFTQDQLNSYYNKLITQLPQLDPNTTLNIANAIYYSQTFSVLPTFLQTNSTFYQANIQPADFTLAATKDAINNWANSQTNGKIPAIIDQIPPGVIMYIINAIYFKSQWNERFDPAATLSKTFYSIGNIAVQAPFMTGNVDYNAYIDNQVSVYELPYSNKKYSMIIAMPINNTALQDVTSSLDTVKWKTWITGLKPVTNQLTLPKFSFSYGASLTNALTTLGMGIAFSNSADFTRISTTTGLTISDIKHKTFISVDETGTTAAAVTSVGITPTAILVNYNVIDHPFLFFIREMGTGLILFTGTVNNPLLAGS